MDIADFEGLKESGLTPEEIEEMKKFLNRDGTEATNLSLAEFIRWLS